MKDLGTERSQLFREQALVAIPPRAVIGFEAEFNLLVNGRRRRPEKVFGDRRLVRAMIPRAANPFNCRLAARYLTPASSKSRGDCWLSPAVTHGARARSVENRVFTEGDRSLGETKQVPMPPARF
jgi:hypothetical protein